MSTDAQKWRFFSKECVKFWVTEKCMNYENSTFVMDTIKKKARVLSLAFLLVLIFLSVILAVSIQVILE